MVGALFMARAQSSTAMVGQQKSPEKRAAHMTKALSKRLNLTAEQSQQVNAILLTQATRMDSLKNNPSADKRGNRMEARTIMLTSERDINALLNDTQKQEFADWQKSRKEKQKAKKDSSGVQE